MRPPPSPVKPKPRTVKTAGVVPEEDDGVSHASGASKGAKRRRRHAGRAHEVEGLPHQCHVLEEAFEKVVHAASTKKPSGCVSEDDTRPNKSPESEIRNIVLAIQRGLRKEDTTLEPKKTGDLAKKACALLGKDDGAGPYTPVKPRRPLRRTPPASVGSMASGMRGPSSMVGSTSRKGAIGALSAGFGDVHAMETMRIRIASRKAK